MIFIDNKYTRIYYSIIERAKLRSLPKNVYTETHHIIPKSLGGNNSLENLVILTAREHFICHRLLVKMTNSNYKNKMVYALWIMLKGNKEQQRLKNINSTEYERIKKEYAEVVRKTKSRKKLSEETKKKISEAKKGKPLKIKQRSKKWYEAHKRTHKGKSNEERKKINTTSDSAS